MSHGSFSPLNLIKFLAPCVSQENRLPASAKTQLIARIYELSGTHIQDLPAPPKDKERCYQQLLKDVTRTRACIVDGKEIPQNRSEFIESLKANNDRSNVTYELINTCKIDLVKFIECEQLDFLEDKNVLIVSLKKSMLNLNQLKSELETAQRQKFYEKTDQFIALSLQLLKLYCNLDEITKEKEAEIQKFYNDIESAVTNLVENGNINGKDSATTALCIVDFLAQTIDNEAAMYLTRYKLVQFNEFIPPEKTGFFYFEFTNPITDDANEANTACCKLNQRREPLVIRENLCGGLKLNLDGIVRPIVKLEIDLEVNISTNKLKIETRMVTPWAEVMNVCERVGC